MRRILSSLSVVVVALICVGSNATAFVQRPPQNEPSAPANPQPESKNVDPKWLDKLPEEDRAAMDVLIGYAPPSFVEGLKWFGEPAGDWSTMRGKVVVVQAFMTATSAGRRWPERISEALKDVSANDLLLIALHTPEKADAAETFLHRQAPPENVKVLIDPDGAFCDSLGIFKHPVNFVIDRNGTVRYAGLNVSGVGLKSAVAELVAEPFDPKKLPTPRPQEKPAEEKPAKEVDFPAVKGSVSGATDLRGKRAPDFASEAWHTAAPNPAGKTAMVTFWSSIDDAASLNSHSQLNTIASRYGNRLVVIAISGDSNSKFEEESMRRRMSKSDFKYAVALDRNNRMARAMNVAASPYTIIMSKDWIVRWQGRTSELKPDIVQQILEADAGEATSTPQRGVPKKRGWKTE